MSSSSSLFLRNPHSVLAVLESRPRDVEWIVIPSKGLAEGWSRVSQLATERGVPIQTQAQAPASEKQGSKSSKFGGKPQAGRQGIPEAKVRAKDPVSVETLFKGSNQHGLWLALDNLQDPQNVGAIFRTASFFGVRGILLTQDRSAPLTSTVYDVASGGVDTVPFAMVTNLRQSLESAKEAGLWILGTSEHAKDTIQSVQKDRSWLMVLGNEESGIRRLTQETCDVLCRIPGTGKVTSLNVSVAAGIMISHLS